MKGYKILLKDMRSPIAGMEYEVGREYEMEGFNRLSSNKEYWGFHFYRSIFLGICHLFPIAADTYKRNFEISDFKVFEIESPNDCCCNLSTINLGFKEYSPYDILHKSIESTICTKKIKLIREINIDEIREIIVKELLINLGFLPLSKFDSDFSSLDVAKIVFDLGYFPDRLIRMRYSPEKYHEYLDVFNQNRKEFEERYGVISITEYDTKKYRYFWWVSSPHKHYPYSKILKEN